MKPIRILDRNFRLLGEIDDYESLVWIRRWDKVHGFEVHMNINKRYTECLQKGSIVLFGDYEGIVRHRESSTEKAGNLIIKGSGLGHLVARRITIPPTGKAYDVVTDNTETIMKAYVNNNCVNPLDSKRVIPDLILGENKGRGERLRYQTRYKQLDEELEKLSIKSGIGWDIRLDRKNKKYIFDVMEGKNLSSSQTVNNPVIFSVDFDNVKEQSYIDSDLEYKNQGYVGGQGEGVDRAIKEVGGQMQGLDRIETFIDARDVEDSSNLESRGRLKLSEMEMIKVFENQIDPYANFIYREDWDLGDIVTVQNKQWNVTTDTRITEVTEIYERNGFRLDVHFGNNIPTVMDEIKKTRDIPLIEKGL